MHHPVSGINSLILSVSLASHVSTHLLIHLSAHLCHHHHSHHPSLLFPPQTSFTYRTAFMTMGLDQTYHAHHLFLVSHFNFLFVLCGGLTWLPISVLLHVKYTLSYRIVLFRSLFRSSLLPFHPISCLFPCNLPTGVRALAANAFVGYLEPKKCVCGAVLFRLRLRSFLLLGARMQARIQKVHFSVGRN